MIIFASVLVQNVVELFISLRQDVSAEAISTIIVNGIVKNVTQEVEHVNNLR